MNKKLFHILGSISRTLLGITFIFSGFVKAIDPLGTTYKIEDYLNAFGGFFTSFTPLAEVAAWGLIAFEFVLGCMLLLNIWTKLSSWLALLMMLFMTPLTLYIALTNPVSDCGCFGDALVLTNWQTFYKNIVLLALVLILLLTKKHIPQLFNRLVEVCLVMGSLGFVLGFMFYSRTHLPVADFRPYKIGNNIPALMEVPDDAPQNVYETTLIYAKDGVEQAFTLENYPKNDPDWTFVDSQSKLISKGYEAPIHDLTMVNEDMEDILPDVLEEEIPVTWAILYKVEKTDMEQAKRLNEMAHLAEENGESFYLLTGSGEAEVEAFRAEAGYDYPIYSCDPVTLKTIVRANPGIVRLQQGTVIDKYNLKNR